MRIPDGDHLHQSGEIAAKRQPVPAKVVLDRVAQRCLSHGMDDRPARETHFKEPPAGGGVAGDFDDLRAVAHAHRRQRAALRGVKDTIDLLALGAERFCRIDH